MCDAESCKLTTKDYAFLEMMRARGQGNDETLNEILERKLSRAVVMLRDDIPPTVVTLSSRVVHRVNDGPSETRIVAMGEMGGLIGMLLPITSPRGLALVGLSEGQSMTFPTADGGCETLTVQEVVYQPEAAARERNKLVFDPGSDRSGSILRVVHSADRAMDSSARKVAPIYESGPDDPGPSAA